MNSATTGEKSDDRKNKGRWLQRYASNANTVPVGTGSYDLATLTGDDEIIEDVEAYADEMVKMFGGQGVKLEETEYSISDLDVGRSLH